MPTYSRISSLMSSSTALWIAREALELIPRLLCIHDRIPEITDRTDVGSTINLLRVAACCISREQISEWEIANSIGPDGQPMSADYLSEPFPWQPEEPNTENLSLLAEAVEYLTRD